jgi:hypothetical protein
MARFTEILSTNDLDALGEVLHERLLEDFIRAATCLREAVLKLGPVPSSAI